ncbi:MAG TPA: thioesterase family protein [Bacteroidales bacterium]|nr:thioesterase family protein [Bacteroidales bacterium]HRZ48317.1 thioesterase family protein [Bacteroidales bacterium]
MLNTLPLPLDHTTTLIVTAEHTASRYGSGLIPVFATPALVGLMEATAQQAVQTFLPEGFITLGTEIHVKHTRATPVGMKVTCTATLTGQSDRAFVFSIEAYDEEGPIGTAIHHRFAVHAQRFLEKFVKS